MKRTPPSLLTGYASVVFNRDMETIIAEATRLTATWVGALDAKERGDSSALDRAEQVAYDELVDFVEAHDLNYTVHDPRGPEIPE